MIQNAYKNDFGTLVLRLGLAVIFLLNGWVKVAQKGSAGWDMVLPGGDQLLIAWSEVLGGFALVFGFWTRLNAVGLGCFMMAAITLVTGDQEFVHIRAGASGDAGVAQDAGFEYLLNFAVALMCLVLVIQGGGRFALDYCLAGRVKKTVTILGWAALLTAALIPLQLMREARSDTQANADSRDLLAELKTYPHKLVYETNRDGNWELYRCNADGSNPVNLTRTPDVDELYPKPSPDGTKICFVADEGKGDAKVRSIYYMNSDGTGRTRIATNGREPCWSPNGTQIAYMKGEFEKFTCTDFATKRLFIYDLKTGHTREHVNHDLHHEYTLNWSPDGRWFVATVHGGMGFTHGVVAIEADGDRIVDLELRGCRPNISPDGKKLCWGHGIYCVGVAELDLSGATPTATYLEDVVESKGPMETYQVTWSPDTKYLTYTCGPHFTGRGLKGLLPEFPGVEAPGWNVCVADAQQKNRWVAITSDGKSCKQPSWVRVREAAPN